MWPGLSASPSLCVYTGVGSATRVAPACSALGSHHAEELEESQRPAVCRHRRARRRGRRLTPAVGERSHNQPAEWIVPEAILCNKPASAPAHMQAPCGAVQRAPAPATHCACGRAQDVGPTAHCEQAPSSEPAGALDPKEWRSFRVMSKEPVTKNTQQLRCGGTLQNRARCTVARS